MSAPLLVALKGHPGAGKSTVARGLGRRLGLPVIDKDDIKDVLDGRVEDAGGLAYAAMFGIARRQLLLGLDVICDSPLSEVVGYSLARGAAHDAGARLAVVECVCSDGDEWRRRIEARGALGLPGHHITSWALLQEHLLRRRASSAFAIAAPHLVVDTVAPLEALLETVVAWLGEQGLTGARGASRGSPAE